MAQSKTIKASCHCGSVQLEADQLPPSVTECNCSICRRYGAQWAYFTCQTARILTAPEHSTSYSWGDGDIAFSHCKTCGCLTHYESVEKTADSRIAINSRMMSPTDIEGIRVRRFDGASSWKFLDE